MRIAFDLLNTLDGNAHVSETRIVELLKELIVDKRQTITIWTGTPIGAYMFLKYYSMSSLIPVLEKGPLDILEKQLDGRADIIVDDKLWELKYIRTRWPDCALVDAKNILDVRQMIKRKNG